MCKYSLIVVAPMVVGLNDMHLHPMKMETREILIHGFNSLMTFFL